MREIERQLAKRPAEVPLHRELTALLLDLRRYQAAIKAAERGLAAAPGDEELTLRLSAALIPLGRASEAVRLVAALPPSAKNRFVLGMAHRAHGQAEPSRSALLEAWALGHRDPYLLYTVIEQDRALGDKEKGLEHFKLFWTEFPDSAWLHLLLADAHFAAGEDSAAEGEFRKALEKDSALPVANFHLGVLRFRAGDAVAAESHFRREIELNPQLGDSYAWLGRILVENHRTTEAAAALEQAVRLDPRSASAFRQLASVQIETRQFTAALSTLQRAKRQFPDDASFAAQLASVLKRLGKTAEARKEAKRAAALMRNRLRERQSQVSAGQRP